MTCDDNTVYMYVYGPHLSLPLSPLAWQQHDVQELCRVMFDALERQFQKDKYERPDLINELYQGTMKDYVKCLKVRWRPALGEGEGEGGRGEGRRRKGRGMEDKGEMPVQWILHCYLQCGYESAREDHFLDILLVIKPFGSTTTHGSVVSGEGGSV